jgi:hypothetical protein
MSGVAPRKEGFATDCLTLMQLVLVVLESLVALVVAMWLSVYSLTRVQQTSICSKDLLVVLPTT